MKKPSEVETVAMAMWAQGNWHREATPQSEWSRRPRDVKTLYRGLAREFLQALRGGR